MQLQTLISNNFAHLGKSKYTKHLVTRLSDILSSECEELTDDYIESQLSETKKERIKQARDIQKELNSGEKPRQDPALKGLNTAQWKCYIRDNPTGAEFKGGFFREKNGRFAKVYRISIWNMQKPFFYRYDFSEEAVPRYTIEGYKSNIPEWARDLGKDNRKYVTPNVPKSEDIQIRTMINKKMVFGTLTNEPYHLEYKTGANKPTLVKNKTSKSINGRRKVGEKNGFGVFHSVGNLAAVRLSVSGGRVYPRNRKNGWLVFWNEGYSYHKVNTRTVRKRTENYDYVFVRSRNKKGVGHDHYRAWVYSVFKEGTFAFIDELWHK